MVEGMKRAEKELSSWRRVIWGIWILFLFEVMTAPIIIWFAVMKAQNLLLVIAGMVFMFIITYGESSAANSKYMEFVKLYFAMKNKLDNLEKNMILLFRSKDIVNQHWELNCCKCCMIEDRPTTEKGQCTEQPPTVTFGDNCTWNGGLNMGQSCKSGNGDDGIKRKLYPVMHADYKVIESLLENLSDDPSKRMFM
jgi:hypothetical protein